MGVVDSVVYDGQQTGELLEAFLADLTRRYGDPSWSLVGIHRRGDILAERLRARIHQERDFEPPLGVLDITLYRDDFSPDRPQPTVRPSRIPFSVDGARILLLDDVFQTGRTIRAALDQLADFGRPRRVILAVFVDRRMRELPICPDHVGVTLERPLHEMVQLRLKEIDGRDEVVARQVGEEQDV